MHAGVRRKERVKESGPTYGMKGESTIFNLFFLFSSNTHLYFLCDDLVEVRGAKVRNFWSPFQTSSSSSLLTHLLTYHLLLMIDYDITNHRGITPGELLRRRERRQRTFLSGLSFKRHESHARGVGGRGARAVFTSGFGVHLRRRSGDVFVGDCLWVFTPGNGTGRERGTGESTRR